MSARILSTREKRLLSLCVGALLLMGTLILANTFMQKRSALLARENALEQMRQEHETWLSDRDYWQSHGDWLKQSMPTTDSLGRSQGQMLEELQNAALDLQLTVERQTLLEPVTTATYREVSLTLRVYGDQMVLLRWLATLQSPEKFLHLKQLDFELDTRARAPKPQARCNLTLAKWFQLEPAA